MEIPEPSKLKDLAASRRKVFKKTIRALKRSKGKETDEKFRRLHEKAFDRIDCLDCANCCKTTSPIFIEKDIDRIAGHLGIKPSAFIEKYLRIDKDGDYVLKSSPCPFLGSDRYCTIYEVRPRACREYPHTNRKNVSGILDLTLSNTKVCPAVYGIMSKLAEENRY